MQKSICNMTGHRGSLRKLCATCHCAVIAQAGSFLMLSQVEDPLSMNMFFSAVESAKFRRPIAPGDQLKVHMNVIAYSEVKQR